MGRNWVEDALLRRRLLNFNVSILLWWSLWFSLMFEISPSDSCVVMHCTFLHRSSNLFLQQFSVFYKDIYLNRQVFHFSFLIQWTQIFPCCENITVQKLNWSRCWWLFLFYELKCTTNFPAIQSGLEDQQQQIRYTRVIWLKTSNKTIWIYVSMKIWKNMFLQINHA